MFPRTSPLEILLLKHVLKQLRYFSHYDWRAAEWKMAENLGFVDRAIKDEVE